MPRTWTAATSPQASSFPGVRCLPEGTAQHLHSISANSTELWKKLWTMMRPFLLQLLCPSRLSRSSLRMAATVSAVQTIVARVKAAVHLTAPSEGSARPERLRRVQTSSSLRYNGSRSTPPVDSLCPARARGFRRTSCTRCAA